MPTKATKTIKQALSYKPQHTAWFEETQAVFNRTAAFYFEVIQVHQLVLELSSKEAVFRYIETLLAIQGRRISIIYSFCSCLYGQRRAKRKTEKIIKELESQKTAANDNHFGESKKEEVKETEKTEGALS